MRFPACVTVCSRSLRCEARGSTRTRPLSKASSSNHKAVGSYNKLQRTLLTTTASHSSTSQSYSPDPGAPTLSAAATATRPRLRSPHNWAHIAHRIRLPTTAMATQTRGHAGHSHGGGHHHHHDSTYLTSANKSDPGVRITRIGLYVNLGMAIAKGTGGVVFNSQALTADALHALTDLISDVTTLMTISYSIRPATARFPQGYGKVESLGALAVSGILLSGGFMIGLQAVMALSQQFFPQIFEALSNFGIFEHAHHHGHDHGAMDLGPNINAAWLAAGSIVVKEWLYRATMKVAKEKRSSVLSSNAYHHRVDSLTAFVALFTIVASHFMASARWLDPVGGLIISGMIVQAGWGNTKIALYELADAGMEEEVREGAEKAAVALLQNTPAEVRGVQGIKSGQNLMFEVEIGVPEDWPVARTNDLEVEIREAIAGKVRGTKRVNVRFTTKNEPAFIDQFVASKEELDGHNDHDHDHDHDHHDHDHSNGAPKANGESQKKK